MLMTFEQFSEELTRLADAAGRAINTASDVGRAHPFQGIVPNHVRIAQQWQGGVALEMTFGSGRRLECWPDGRVLCWLTEERPDAVLGPEDAAAWLAEQIRKCAA